MKKIIATTAAALLLAACTSSGSEDPGLKAEPTETTSATPAPVDPAEDLDDEVETYSGNFLSGRGELAYDQLTQKCKDSIAKTEFLDVVTEATATYGDLPILSLDHVIDGNVAKVTYTYSDGHLNQTDEQWIKEDGVWKNDDC